VRVISQQEVGFEREKGALIVDIRPSGEFEAGEYLLLPVLPSVDWLEHKNVGTYLRSPYNITDLFEHEKARR